MTTSLWLLQRLPKVTLGKFAPELLDVPAFKAAQGNDRILSAIKLLQDLNRSGKRNMPRDCPMPFRKDWAADVGFVYFDDLARWSAFVRL
jgi:hypothetical protein